MLKINNKVDCCGCGACYNVCPKNCISMKQDNEGFAYPKIDYDVCIDCGLCEKVCPILNNKPEQVVEQRAYLLQNKDEQVLRESTSGGAFTAIAKTILKRGGVVFGAGFDENFVVRHICVDKEADLKKYRNSKYVQSDIGDTFAKAKEYLENDRWVCFSGTPCQIEGFKSYLRKPYDKLLLVDIVCHAVPSPLVWEKYKKYRADNGKITQAAFRDKEKYGYEYSQASMTVNNVKKNWGVETDPYMRAFFCDLSDRPSCYDCKFKKRYRVCDITIWDCFDVYKLEKSLDNNKGVTRMLVHSQKGVDFVNEIENATLVEIDTEKAVEGVRELVKSVNMNSKRNAFFEDINNMEEKVFFEKYFADTLKVKVERTMRRLFEKMGIYKYGKRFIKKVFSILKISIR